MRIPPPKVAEANSSDTRRRLRSRARVLVFAKAPVPGYCKTRLANAVGMIAAARLQMRLIRKALHVASASGFDTQLWFAPDGGHPSVQRLRARYGVTLHRQPHGDLGKRMSAALSQALKTTSAALVIGVDCPGMTAATLRQAVETLERGADAVFVPAEDGGYVLVGLRRAQPRLFRGVDWGGARVMAQTRHIARRLGLHWGELPMLWDMDDRSDWRRARRGGWI